MLESTVSKLAQIFDLNKQTNSTASVGKSKAERMLAGSKTTKILANGSVYSVSVVETPVTGPQSSAVGHHSNDSSLQGKAPLLSELKRQNSLMFHNAVMGFDAITSGEWYNALQTYSY